MIKRLNSVSSFQFFHLVRYAALGVTGIVFAKTGLTQDAIGAYETFLFLAGAVSFFWLNGLLKALLPISSGKAYKTVAVFSAFVVISLFSIVVALLFVVIHPVIADGLLRGTEVPAPGLMIIYLVFGIPANLVEYYYLIRKRNRALVIYGVVSFAVQFLLVVTPVVAGLPVWWAMAGLVVASVLRYVWLWGLFIFHSEVVFSMAFVRDHLRLGGPLVLSTLLSGTAQYVDGFIITSGFDESTFAIFRYGARELPLAVLLTNALGSALLPAFGVHERLKENLEQLKRSISRLMHLLFPVTGVLILVSHPLFPWLFNPDFRESATIFNIYLLLVISRVLMPQTILTGLQHTRPLIVASLLELLINVGLSLMFVRYWGISGVAYATLIAYLFEKIYLAMVVKRRLNLSFSEYQPVKYYLIYSCGILALFIFAETIF